MRTDLDGLKRDVTLSQSDCDIAPPQRKSLRRVQPVVDRAERCVVEQGGHRRAVPDVQDRLGKDRGGGDDADVGEGGVISTTGDMIRFMKALVIDGTLVPESQMGALEAFFAAISDSEDGEVIGHQGATFGSLSMTLVHVPSGTIFSASETMRYGPTEVSAEVYEALGELLENPAWHASYTNGDDIDFATSAADLQVSEIVGTNGIPDTLLSVDGVTLHSTVASVILKPKNSTSTTGRSCLWLKRPVPISTFIGTRR